MNDRIMRQLTFSLVILLLIASSTAFHMSTIQSSNYPSRLFISNIFKNNDSTSSPQLPKDVKDAVSKCREAVQKGLEGRLSRMDVEFPVGTKFGIEKDAKKRGGGKGRLMSAMAADDNSSADGGVTKDMLETSDRELARLFVDMFQPVGGDNIAVVFSEDSLKDLAMESWRGDPTASCRIMSITRGARKSKSSLIIKGIGSGKKKQKLGFAAKMNEEFSDESSGPFKLPENCEVALFVAPTAKDLIKINNICNDVGMGTLVVLLNARLDLIQKSQEVDDYYKNEFEKVYYLSIAPQSASPGCLLYRAYPNDWVLARKPKVGTPKTVCTFPNRPSDDDCKSAYENIKIGDVEKGVEDVLGNVATWLK